VVFFVSVAVAIVPLVSVEVLGGAVPPLTWSVAMMRIVPVVAVIRVVTIVDVAVEVFRTVKPSAGTDKDAVGKPLWTVVTVRSATVRRGFEVTVRTSGRYTDADADLGLGSGSTCCNAETSDGGQSEKFYSAHKFTSPRLEKGARLEVAPQIVAPVWGGPRKVALSHEKWPVTSHANAWADSLGTAKSLGEKSGGIVPECVSDSSARQR
jgi:hypothetical protein